MSPFIILVVFSLFPFLSLKAAQLHFFSLESEKTKERALFLEGGHVIYFFTDRTIAYLRLPPYETRTWSEWWNNRGHIQPDPQFYFQLERWNNFSFFQFYRYEWIDHPDSHVLEPLFNQNLKLASEYPYFIENCETGEKTLCQIWSLSDLGSFIIRYGEECYDDGFASGMASCN